MQCWLIVGSPVKQKPSHKVNTGNAACCHVLCASKSSRLKRPFLALLLKWWCQTLNPGKPLPQMFKIFQVTSFMVVIHCNYRCDRPEIKIRRSFASTCRRPQHPTVYSRNIIMWFHSQFELAVAMLLSMVWESVTSLWRDKTIVSRCFETVNEGEHQRKNVTMHCLNDWWINNVSPLWSF